MAVSDVARDCARTWTGVNGNKFGIDSLRVVEADGTERLVGPKRGREEGRLTWGEVNRRLRRGARIVLQLPGLGAVDMTGQVRFDRKPLDKSFKTDGYVWGCPDVRLRRFRADGTEYWDEATEGEREAIADAMLLSTLARVRSGASENSAHARSVVDAVVGRMVAGSPLLSPVKYVQDNRLLRMTLAGRLNDSASGLDGSGDESSVSGLLRRLVRDHVSASLASQGRDVLREAVSMYPYATALELEMLYRGLMREDESTRTIERYNDRYWDLSPHYYEDVVEADLVAVARRNREQVLARPPRLADEEYESLPGLGEILQAARELDSMWGMRAGDPSWEEDIVESEDAFFYLFSRAEEMHPGFTDWALNRSGDRLLQEVAPLALSNYSGADMPSGQGHSLFPEPVANAVVRDMESTVARGIMSRHPVPGWLLDPEAIDVAQSVARYVDPARLGRHALPGQRLSITDSALDDIALALSGMQFTAEGARSLSEEVDSLLESPTALAEMFSGYDSGYGKRIRYRPDYKETLGVDEMGEVVRYKERTRYRPYGLSDKELTIYDPDSYYLTKPEEYDEYEKHCISFLADMFRSYYASRSAASLSFAEGALLDQMDSSSPSRVPFASAGRILTGSHGGGPYSTGIGAPLDDIAQNIFSSGASEALVEDLEKFEEKVRRVVDRGQREEGSEGSLSSEVLAAMKPIATMEGGSSANTLELLDDKLLNELRRAASEYHYNALEEDVETLDTDIEHFLTDLKKAAVVHATRTAFEDIKRTHSRAVRLLSDTRARLDQERKDALRSEVRERQGLQ